MYWNYHYLKYLVILFTLLGFHLFMLNKYHFSLGYFNWFILFTCMNILGFYCIFYFIFLHVTDRIKTWLSNAHMEGVGTHRTSLF